MLYVYAVVPGDAIPSTTPPPGLDDASVRIIRAGNVAALVSTLDRATYSNERLELLTSDVNELGPRAAAHDRVVTWASDQVAAVPLPLFSLFNDDQRVVEMLDTRALELGEALRRVGQGREYSLRVYRLDDALEASLTQLSPDIAAKTEALESASPGQRYLLERKLDKEKQSAVRQVGRDVATEIWNALKAKAVDSVSEPAPRGASGEIPLVLNASFLVAHDGYDDFRTTLSHLIERYGSHGFRFDFTGPWPAYHFVGQSPDRVS